MAQNKQVSGGDKKKKAWLTCGPRTSSGDRPFWVPQNDLVVGPAAREKPAVKTPGDAVDQIAAIFSNVREHICCGRLRLSPPESTPLPR